MNWRKLPVQLIQARPISTIPGGAGAGQRSSAAGQPWH